MLEQRCYLCHGEQVQMKNVRLDSPEALKQHAQAVPTAGDVLAVLEQRCAICHGAQVQMKNVRLDSPALLKQHAQSVYQQVVLTRAMPMNNSTGITDAERAVIGRWFTAGAKTD